MFPIDGCHELRPSERSSPFLSVVGLTILFLAAVAYGRVFTYPVVTRDVSNGMTQVTITYVYPLEPFFPLFLSLGLFLLVYGLTGARHLLAMSRTKLALIFALGGVLTLNSLANIVHVMGISFEAIQYGFPLPWFEYVIDSLGPVHRWIVAPDLIFVSIYLFWVGIGYVGLIVATSLKRIFETKRL